MKRLLAGSVLTLAVAAFAAFAGTGLAARTVTITGSMANGGCGSVHPVTVAGPQRLVVQVSATAAETGPPATGPVYVQFLSSSGAVLASGPTAYTTSGAGSFGVRVCSTQSSDNPAQLQYTGDISILAPGMVVSKATGKAGIRAHSTIVWFNVSATRTHASVHVDDALHKVHLGASTGLRVTLGQTKVTITGKGMTLVITGAGVQQHIVFHSRAYSVSGNVVKGAITIA